MNIKNRERNKCLYKIEKYIQKIIFYSSFLLLLGVSICYLVKPDSFAVVTFFSPLFWFIPGIILAVLGWDSSQKHLSVAIILLWVLFLFVFGNDIRSMIQFRHWPNPKWETAREKGEAIRIISLNCAGSNIEAAKEVIQYDPDIVLLQESPSYKELELLAKELFADKAGMVIGIDASIIVRGKVQTYPEFRSTHITKAHIQLTSGIETEVISLHLRPPGICLNVLLPSCWKEHTAYRYLDRQSIERIVEQIKLIPKTIPIIVGGDFNIPANDAVAFQPFRPYLSDSFREGGIGWGKTALNDIPVVRIDQIWISKHFKVVSSVAKKTINSDHRMVICDVLIKK